MRLTVKGQLATLSEPLSTSIDVASIRQFPSMNKFMLYQILFDSKLFVTLLANVGLLDIMRQ
jgi:hypothetical protein